MRLHPYLRLLRRNPAFARLYAAQLTSFAGDWFATVALLGLTLELTGSPAVASLVLVIQTAAFSLASPIAGAFADRIDRRRLLIVADLARVPIALAFLLARDPSTLWIAFAATAGLSFGAALFEPTSSASLPNLVEDEELPEANVLIGSAWGTMLAVGAALGGVVAATLGRDAAFVVNAGSFAASAALIWGIRRPFQRARAAEGHSAAASWPSGPMSGLASALRFVRTSRRVAAFLLSKTTFGVGTGVVLLLAVFGRDVFGAGEAGIGLLFAARGLGALIGPFVARAVLGSQDHALLRGIAFSFVATTVCYSLFPIAPSIWLAALLVFGAHCGGGAQWTLSSLGLQRAAPDAIRGRVFSLDYALVTFTIAGSTLAAGMLADTLPPRVAVWTMAALIALAGAGWVLFSRPAWRVAAGGAGIEAASVGDGRSVAGLPGDADR
ncbi:MAG TPA: MFS transporter [Candidatus Limnocylindria bacterium]|nr:MFS transporter [Candidatus Limnocylindria bacterium]